MVFLGWIIAIAGMTVGLVGIVLPLLPGLGLIWAAALIHKLCLPESVTWWTLGAMGLLALAGAVAEWTAGAAGVKWFGGTKWGMGGALLGGLIGLFFGLPGLIVGPLAGAMIAEKIFARRTFRQASTAGVGVAAGFVASAGIKLGLGITMIVLFLGDALWW
jgi:uncharacterized protein YqgC (DUF456 family)